MRTLRVAYLAHSRRFERAENKRGKQVKHSGLTNQSDLTRCKEVPHYFILLAAGVVTSSWFFFMLADYGWERKKSRGLGIKDRPSKLGTQSERTDYEWYSWIRYLAVILVTNGF